MCVFLVGVWCTARNPTPPGEGLPVIEEARQKRAWSGEEARQEGLEVLAGDMHDFDPEDKVAARDR